ncbi:MAG: hypothetical protein D6702_02475 [Planctomycetota bacterium]|nr:MAG: hypothetical protein D6702_02475 [Planctomycetota bacterium]
MKVCSALLALLLAACESAPAVRRQEAPPPRPEGGGRATVTVHLAVAGGPSRRVADFAGLTLAGAAGEYALGLDRNRVPLGAGDRGLATGRVPAGFYRGLRVVLDHVWSDDPDQGGVPLLLENASLLLPLPLSLEDEDSVDLLLHLDLARSSPEPVTFSPAWSLSLAEPLLPFDMVLAADGRSGGVCVFDRIQQRAHRTLLPGHAVVGLVRGLASNELLAVDRSTDEVVVFDLSRGEIRDQRRLPAGGGPVWASHLPLGAGIAVSMAGRRELSFFELPSMMLGERTPTTRAPGRSITSSALRRLYLLLPEANELQVFSTDSQERVATRLLEAGPVDLDLDEDGQRLAVVSSRAGVLQILDAASLEVRQSWHVGAGLGAVLFDPQENRVFVALAQPSSLVAVDLGTGQLSRPTDLPAAAADLALDPEGRRIWAACPGASTLAVIDRFQLRVRALVPAPGAPDRLLLPGLPLK